MNTMTNTATIGASLLNFIHSNNNNNDNEDRHQIHHHGQEDDVVVPGSVERGGLAGTKQNTTTNKLPLNPCLLLYNNKNSRKRSHQSSSYSCMWSSRIM